MNRKPFIALAAGMFALLSSCSDNVIEADSKGGVNSSYNSSLDIPAGAHITKGKLSVFVQDANEGWPLNMSVTLLATKQKVTAVNGIAVFDSLTHGTYSVLVEDSTGVYASMQKSVILSIHGERDLFVVADGNSNFALYPKNSGLTGYVYYKGTDGKSLPVTGATVRVALIGDFTSDKITETVTGVGGYFAFANLPAVGDDYELWVLDKKIETRAADPVLLIPADSTLFAAFQGPTISLQSKITTHITSMIEYNNPVSLFDIVKIPEFVTPKGSLEIVYSDFIDVSKFRKEEVFFRNNNIAITIPVEVVVKDSSIKITPYGEWPNSFTLHVSNLKSVQNKTNSELNNGRLIRTERGDFDLISVAGDVNSKTTLGLSDTLVIVYSDKIDATQVRNNTVSFSFPSSTLTRPAVVEVKDNTLRIAPVGEWPEDFTVYVSTLYSIQNKSNSDLTVANGGRSIRLTRTDLATSPPITLAFSSSSSAIDAIDAGVNLVWSKVLGAARYEVYCKLSSQESYRRALNVEGINNLSASVSFSACGNTASSLDTNKVSFFVQAHNDMSRTVPSNVIIAKDDKKPTPVATNYLIAGEPLVEFGFNTHYGYTSSYTYYAFTYWPLATAYIESCYLGYPNQIGYWTYPSTTVARLIQYYDSQLGYDNNNGGNNPNGNGLSPEGFNYHFDLAHKLGKTNIEEEVLIADDFYNPSTGTNDYYTGQFFFSEPIDTTGVTITALPVVEGEVAVPSRLQFKIAGWSSDRKTLYVVFTVRAEMVNANLVKSPVNQRFRIANLKDPSGNLFEVRYANAATPAANNEPGTMDFRIKTNGYDFTQDYRNPAYVLANGCPATP